MKYAVIFVCAMLLNFCPLLADDVIKIVELDITKSNRESALTDVVQPYCDTGYRLVDVKPLQKMSSFSASTYYFVLHFTK